jgi:CheY-like chemotaxis protein
VADLLADAGYAVVQASDGLEALQQLKATRPDLIVLDLMLPRMSGWQFLGLVLASQPAVCGAWLGSCGHRG